MFDWFWIQVKKRNKNINGSKEDTVVELSMTESSSSQPTNLQVPSPEFPYRVSQAWSPASVNRSSANMKRNAVHPEVIPLTVNEVHPEIRSRENSPQNLSKTNFQTVWMLIVDKYCNQSNIRTDSVNLCEQLFGFYFYFILNTEITRIHVI